MARRSNYAFERYERAKAKAAKRQAKREAKAALREDKQGEPDQPSEPDAAD
ncbi:MAG: hypothetical protein IH996_08240 [Proteobacteria bacterium]|nr:hypothetical protein [Pseudomonadota bacterium]